MSATRNNFGYFNEETQNIKQGFFYEEIINLYALINAREDSA